jgi:hypothetical protein
VSNYVAFDIVFGEDDGSQTPAAGVQTVKVYNVTGGAALADLASDASGHVAAGALAVAAGTLVRFSAQRTDGRAGYAEQVTT